MGKVILYYKYIFIEYPKRISKWQEKLCLELKLTGRVIIAFEGINGTLGGSEDAIEQYKTIMKTDILFADIDFKESSGSNSCFPRLQIKIKNEIVHFGLDPQKITAKQGAKHITPQEVHALIQYNPQNLVLFDARNAYESHVGAFEGAVKPPINYFRELPAFIDNNLALFENKQVLMYCTGGVRCERASAYLKEKGVAKEVLQIEGGIHHYVEQYPDGYFKGKNYVFDARTVMKINEEVLGHCFVCSASCDEYTNCLNALCNKHFIGCNHCINQFKNTCGRTCYQLLYIEQKTPMRPTPVIMKKNV